MVFGSVTIGVFSSIILVPRSGLVGAAIAVLLWQTSTTLICVSLCRELFFSSGIGIGFSKLISVAICYCAAVFTIVSNEMPVTAHLAPIFALLVWMRISNWSLETFRMLDQQIIDPQA